MAESVSAVLGVGDETSEFLSRGYVDVFVSGLTAGEVKLQVLFPRESTWRDVPEGTFTADVWKTMYVSEHGVKCKLVGSANNAGVYARLGRYDKN